NLAPDLDDPHHDRLHAGRREHPEHHLDDHEWKVQQPDESRHDQHHDESLGTLGEPAGGAPPETLGLGANVGHHGAESEAGHGRATPPRTPRTPRPARWGATPQAPAWRRRDAAAAPPTRPSPPAPAKHSPTPA